MEEMMNTTIEEVKENDVIEETNETSDDNSGAGVAIAMVMLIGSGLTLAAIAAGKAIKKAWLKRKAKKEEAESKVDDDVIETEAEEIIESEEE